MSSEITIMVVDDSATMRKITRHHLTQLGFSKIVEAAVSYTHLTLPTICSV